MSRMSRWEGILVLAVVLVLAGAIGASAATAPKLPPPDMTGLIPLAALPLDKPPVPLPAVALPAPPQGLPDLPAPRAVTDPAQRPIAPLPPPRTLACNPIGTVLGVASELVECGRARFQRDELEDAQVVLQKATRETTDRRLLREARYWLGQTMLRLSRSADAQPILLLVVQDDPRSEFALYAAADLGWIALEAGDPRRALEHFDSVLKLGPPAPLVAHAHHGRAMALYGLKRYSDARDEWMQLLTAGAASRPSVPSAVASEANFWLGETLGRLGDYKNAVARLGAFTTSKPRVLVASGFLSLGWWSRAAGQPADAVKAYRALLASYPAASEAPWARAGLVQALLDLDDYAGAREEARKLDQSDRGGTFSTPAWLLIRQWLAVKSRGDDARALDDQLLARKLEPSARAWVLLVSAEQTRQSGQSDEARTRFELVRQTPVLPGLGYYAAFRLAQGDFELREFARTEAGAKSLLAEPLPAELRAAVLLLGAEAAYWARDYDDAVVLYTRFLTDASSPSPSSSGALLAVGWAELRRGHLDAARQRWTAFAQQASSDPHAAEALLLSAELAAKAGDTQTARAQLGEVISKFPNSEPAQVATLNRALLTMEAGRAADALPELTTLATRASSSTYGGRVRVAKGVALLAVGRPAAAQPDFEAALKQGEDVLPHLGLGVVAFARADWNVAGREFTAARDTGAGAVADVAQYGLAAAAFNSGKTDEFRSLAAPLLSKPDDPRITPPLLLGMESVAAQAKNWSEARDLALRLSTRFPQNEAAPAVLADLGATAGAEGQWALAREMYETLNKRYPGSKGPAEGRLVFAESLLRTRASVEAGRELDGYVKTLSPRDPKMPEALLLLAQAQEANGNRTAALDTYTRLDREYPDNKQHGAAMLGMARLLQADGKWTEASGQLKRLLDEDDRRLVVEAAYRLGEGLRGAGQNEDAVEAYMTAAYLGADSVWARRALLGAGQSFIALKQPESAAIVYKKLLAAPGVEPDLAAEARNGLKALGVN
ncbi:MAG TPA: tetratricopeptide repeat protein [Candidatus Methylomirabilis sp.]|nr:tetratricopeptide repeat protein [Candidatus Methylomirabilis sp.]